MTMVKPELTCTDDKGCFRDLVPPELGDPLPGCWQLLPDSLARNRHRARSSRTHLPRKRDEARSR